MQKSEEKTLVYEDGWLDVNVELPPGDDYILVSFENFSLPDIARFERNELGEGTFYPGDREESYISLDLYVNAWRPLPKPYRREEIADREVAKMKYKDMDNLEIRKITYEDCPLKCTGDEMLCEVMSVGQCRKNLSLAFDDRYDMIERLRNLISQSR